MNFTEIVAYLASSMGFGLTDLILLMTFLGAIILYAKDFKLGVISHFLLFSTEFIIFSLLGLETYKALIALLLSFIVLTLSLYTSGHKVSIA